MHYTSQIWGSITSWSHVNVSGYKSLPSIKDMYQERMQEASSLELVSMLLSISAGERNMRRFQGKVRTCVEIVKTVQFFVCNRVRRILGDKVLSLLMKECPTQACLRLWHGLNQDVSRACTGFLRYNKKFAFSPKTI